MVRILVETSLPFRAIEGVRERLGPMPPGIEARFGLAEGGAGCEGAAAGGEARWTPCWLSLEGENPTREAVRAAAEALKALVAEACRLGGVELCALPASAQIEDGFYRLRDVVDAADRLP